MIQRKRLHINDLITAPGNVELDLGGLYSYTTGLFTMPSALKYTPAGNSRFRGRTEYSVAFDSVASAVQSNVRSTQFSDRLTFAATSVVFDSTNLAVAVAPQLTVFLRDESGTRIGAAAIVRYECAGTTLGCTASWSGATSPTDTNPAGTWEWDTGLGQQLAKSGFLSRLTPHGNATVDKSTGFGTTLAVFGGLEYQFSERAALDISAQRYGLAGGVPDRQIVASLTITLGRVQ